MPFCWLAATPALAQAGISNGGLGHVCGPGSGARPDGLARHSPGVVILHRAIREWTVARAGLTSRPTEERSLLGGQQNCLAPKTPTTTFGCQDSSTWWGSWQFRRGQRPKDRCNRRWPKGPTARARHSQPTCSARWRSACASRGQHLYPKVPAQSGMVADATAAASARMGKGCAALDNV